MMDWENEDGNIANVLISHLESTGGASSVNMESDRLEEQFGCQSEQCFNERHRLSVELNRFMLVENNLKEELKRRKSRQKELHEAVDMYKRKLLNALERTDPTKNELNEVKNKLISEISEKAQIQCEAAGHKVLVSQLQALVSEKEQEMVALRRQNAELRAELAVKSSEAKKLHDKHQKLKDEHKQATGWPYYRRRHRSDESYFGGPADIEDENPIGDGLWSPRANVRDKTHRRMRSAPLSIDEMITRMDESLMVYIDPPISPIPEVTMNHVNDRAESQVPAEEAAFQLIRSLAVEESQQGDEEILLEVDEIQPEIDEIHKEVDEIHKEVDEIHKEVDEIHKEVGEIQPEVDEIQKEVGELQVEDTQRKDVAIPLVQEAVGGQREAQEGVELLSPVSNDAALVIDEDDTVQADNTESVHCSDQQSQDEKEKSREDEHRPNEEPTPVQDVTASPVDENVVSAIDNAVMSVEEHSQAAENMTPVDTSTPQQAQCNPKRGRPLTKRPATNADSPAKRARAQSHLASSGKHKSTEMAPLCKLSNRPKENRAYATILGWMMARAENTVEDALAKWMKKPKGNAVATAAAFVEAIKQCDNVQNDKKLMELLSCLLTDDANGSEWKKIPRIMMKEIKVQLAIWGDQMSPVQWESLCRWCFDICRKKPSKMSFKLVKEILLIVCRLNDRSATREQLEVVLNVFVSLASIWPNAFKRIIVEPLADTDRILRAVFKWLLYNSTKKSEWKVELEQSMGQMCDLSEVINDQEPDLDGLIADQLAVLTSVSTQFDITGRGIQPPTEFTSSMNKLRLLVAYSDVGSIEACLESSASSIGDWYTRGVEQMEAMGGITTLIANILLLAGLAPYCTPLMETKIDGMVESIEVMVFHTDDHQYAYNATGNDRNLLSYATVEMLTNSTVVTGKVLNFMKELGEALAEKKWQKMGYGKQHYRKRCVEYCNYMEK